MDPAQFLTEQLDTYKTDTLIASTTVFESQVPEHDWPYYSFESGQHLTFYQPRTLDLLARKAGCAYIRLAGDLHMFTRSPIPPWKLWILRTRVVRRLHGALTRYRRAGKSLIVPDYEKLRGELLNRRPEEAKKP